MTHTHEHEQKSEHDGHENKHAKIENVVIIGSGISGNTAAIYASRANLNPLVIAGTQGGGQITMTTEIDNFPGFPDGIMGPQLAENSRKQAERFGTRYKEGVVLGFEKKENHFELTLGEEEKIQTKTIIVATGATARWLGIPSEQKFKGRGLSTCATCDGFFYKGKEILVIGGGDSAMEEATFLAKIASKVTIVHRRDEFRASKTMQDRVFNTPNIEVIWNKGIQEILGDLKGVTGAKLKDTITGEISEISCHGIFLALGHVPNTRIFKGILDMDELGYLTTTDTRTNIPGIFASGDVQDKKYRQAITAAGTGCQAALEVERYLHELAHKVQKTK